MRLRSVITIAPADPTDAELANWRRMDFYGGYLAGVGYAGLHLCKPGEIDTSTLIDVFA